MSHFDLHYYFVNEADVDAITAPGPLPLVGIATYDIPEERSPRHYVYEEPRFIVKNMANISTLFFPMVNTTYKM